MKIETSGPLLYRGGYKYRTEADLSVKTPLVGMPFVITSVDGKTPWARLDADGWAHAFKGYCWDGPSGPTFDHLFGEAGMRPSVFHDIPYQGARLGHLEQDDKLRQRVDEFFRDFCIHDGMSVARADLWYAGIREGAGYAWKRKLEIVHEAPSGKHYEVLPGSSFALKIIGAQPAVTT